MANKYIREGAAFNGDGTTSAVAASNGAPGAWNTLAYFEGGTPAYGSIVAGDVVYIRSKSAAGFDITRSISTTTNLGSAAATTSDHVRWVLDGGAVWSGISGSLTYSSVQSQSVLRSYNAVDSDVRGALAFVHTSSNSASPLFTLGVDSEARHVMLDMSAQTANGAYLSTASSTRCRLVSPTIKSRSRQSGFGVVRTTDYSVLTVVDPDIELLSVSTNPVFAPGNLGGKIDVVGGSIWGAGATTGVPLALITQATGGVTLLGTDVPKTMSLVVPSAAAGNNGILEIVAVDGGVGSAYADWRWGEMDSRSDGYYPTLNSFLPTSTPAPWSWRLWPNKTARGVPFKVPAMKLYTADDAAKTLTCNFLIADSFIGASKHSIWLEVQYTDATTGQRKHLDSRARDDEAIDVSTADWSATTYGPVNLLRRQIAVTTPTAIRKDTVVVATLRGFIRAESANDLMFICPDVVAT